MKSKPVKACGKLFRYDFDNGIVEYVSKADKSMLADNEEWQAKHGRNLWDIDEDGYLILASVGLSKKNWENKAARAEYLFEWSCELEEESAALAHDFEKYELPYWTKKLEEEQK